MSQLSVVIPAYNEVRTIRDVAARARAMCELVFVVDDGSKDGTVAALQDLDVTVIRQNANGGKGAALWRGMQAAVATGADAVITLDADGQHCPEDIPRFVEAWKAQPDRIIVGARLADKESFPTQRYYANRIANFWIAWAAGYPISDSQSGFRLYPAALLRQLRFRVSRQKGFVFESEILIKAARCGFRSTPIPIAAVYAQGARPSYFRSFRDIAFITRMVAWSLISHGLNPAGFYRAFVRPGLDRVRTSSVGRDALAMLALSCLVMLASVGLSYLLALVHVLRIALGARCVLDTSAEGDGWLLVLGMELRGREISQDYAARLWRAVEMHRRQPQRKILVLGGQTGRSSMAEAEAGRDFLLREGVEPAVVTVENRSRNTFENLREARMLVSGDARSLPALVTNRYHLARAHALAASLRLAHSLCPAEDRLALTVMTVFKMLKEAFHLHWYLTGLSWARLTRNQRMLARLR
ncbi:MAG: glycosyltransferase [Pseudomonadota bacterium]|nr:MAG: glycosyltransferase [Pseudomonadota bacterium]